MDIEAGDISCKTPAKICCLLGFKDNCSKTLQSFYQYSRDEPNKDLADSKSYKFEIKLKGITAANDN